MPSFASHRERRLWCCTLAVLLAIYATLGLASKLAGVPQVWQAIIFVTCMVLVGATVLTQGLRARPGGVEIGVALGIAAVYLLLFARLGFPERSHLIEYSVVAVFIYEALVERRSQGRRVPLPAIITIVLTTLAGTIDECIQLVLPSRVFDPVDILFNFLASVMAVVGLVLLGLVRRLVRREKV